MDSRYQRQYTSPSNGGFPSRHRSLLDDFGGSLFSRDLFADHGFGLSRNLMSGGFGRDPFASDPFFSSPFGAGLDLHRDMMPEGGQGNFVSKSFSYSRTLGPDGKPVEVQHIVNERSALDKDGKQIREREEINMDSENDLKTVTKERQLNDKKVKITKEIKDGEKNVYKEFENLEEEEAEDFHREWTETSEKNQIFKGPQIEERPRPAPKTIKYVVRERQ